VQNKNSAELLKSIQITNTSLCGDTRFDRVYEHAQVADLNDLIIRFCDNKPVFVAGSTWPADEVVLEQLQNDFPEMKVIIVPHEISENHIQSIIKKFNNTILYTELEKNYTTEKNILIVNTIGMLSSIYKIAKYCYIGGGFGAGIHNTLEAAAFGKPIFFGPNYSKFQEAKDLINIGAAKNVNNYAELSIQIKELNRSEKLYEERCELARNYVSNNYGASDKIIAYLEENNYLN
jgi:3-deoxy-D-manno-octulosonic-acid transferase